MAKTSFSFSIDAKTRDICNGWIDKAGIRNRGHCSGKINRAIHILNMVEEYDNFELLSDNDQVIFLAHYLKMTELLARFRYLDNEQRILFKGIHGAMERLLNKCGDDSTIPDQDI